MLHSLVDSALMENMKKNEKFRWKVLQIQKIVIPLQRI